MIKDFKDQRKGLIRTTSSREALSNTQKNYMQQLEMQQDQPKFQFGTFKRIQGSAN